MANSPTPTANIEQRIGQYIMLRDKISAADADHKEKMKPAREALEKLNAFMLAHLQQIGGDSVKASTGTVYRTTKTSVGIEDPDAFMRHVIGSESWELLDRKANVTAVKEFLSENGTLPPGTKMTNTQVVGVRRS